MTLNRGPASLAVCQSDRIDGNQQTEIPGEARCPRPFLTGTRLGRYEIRSQLGVGGMGEVYLAQDTEIERTVALKAPTIWEVFVKEKGLFVKYEGTEYALTRSGERGFSFGSANENE